MKLREDLMLRHLGDEYVIIDPEQDMVDMSKVYTLNETAAFLWKELQGKEFNVETVTEVLLNYYNVEYAVAEKDAQRLVHDFEKQGLLTH
ncbi:PqqD family protein [Elizabethkingia anophelis]|uniref:PqqD family protein n=1 Tax=Elizabethkingia anophelis TaxID=1117645 RepID=UPI000CE96BA0|nr:PqqD family protein [Elizabethkingia anophelis]AVF48040.1 PqqD family protein [Elizabethkingia anophelis]AVF52034.1 PqqD family protein [Elizabethkingia anophelis]MBG0505650.1 PqqD family protein [Elizabethkingia anophelis]MCT4073531.1 PqqD family protein [Elizabethkingia anophelis]MDV2492190.1 PqqD family protein [Elizabethkingia anophelis]